MSITLADIDVSTASSSSSSSHENKGRRVISRLNSNTIKVLQSLNPGKATNGCFLPLTVALYVVFVYRREKGSI